MYSQTVGDLQGVPLLLGAFVLYFAGSSARNASSLAAKNTPLIFFATFILLVLIGASEYSLSVTEFLKVEFVNLAQVGIALYGLVSIVLRFGLPLYQSCVSKPWQRYLRAVTERNAKLKRERAARESEKFALERARQYEADRPERERREQAERRRASREAKRAATEASRKEEARAKTLLVYHRHAGEIADSFPWERYCDYSKRYMSDSLPAEQVESNAEKLIDMISSFFEDEKAPPQKRNRQEIHAQFEREREEILSLNYSQEETEAALARIAFKERQSLMEESQ